MPDPSVASRIHTVSRAGEPAEASDDAAHVRADGAPVRAAVADGATESVYAGVWARILTQKLVEAEVGTAEAFGTAVEAGQAAWQAAVDDRSAEQPWYVTAKVEQGAFATALALSIHDDGQWQAVGAGDCCLFQVRDGTLHRAWPIDDPEAFTHRPTLVPSLPQRSVPAPQTTQGDWAAGDAFLLATDAVAAWLLRTDPADALSMEAAGFESAVDEARAAGTLRNDDATLVVLKTEVPPTTDASEHST